MTSLRLFWCLLLVAPATVAQEVAPGWAWRALQRPEVPAVTDAAWVRNEVDRFVLARLEQRGLRPAPEADRVALLRRVTYALTGLPPTPDEVAAFAADPAPDAYERVVERLLGSPQYGVHWGRHWLDLVRFAETDSYERDNRKPQAWRYRDYVIDAFNADVPYGRFLREQLAGDELPDAGLREVTATGYYRLGIWDDEPTDVLQAQFDDLDGIVDTTARVMLGMSMGCARCHDHKKDPITAVDYYSFAAWFENLKPYKVQAGAGLSPENYVRRMPRDGEREQFAGRMEHWQSARRDAVVQLHEAAERSFAEMTPEVRVAHLMEAEQGLVAHYSADRLTAAELRADVGAHHGLARGQVVQVPGKQGQAMQFDGDDHVELPRLIGDSFTISFWMWADRGGRGRPGDYRWFTGEGLVDGEVSGIVRDFGIGWHREGRVMAGVGAPETFVHSAAGYDDGNWHHVAFTRDRETGRIALYVDGELAGEAVGNRERLDAPPRLMVGALQPGGRGFRGRLDELRFHDRALSHEEVLTVALELRGGAAMPALMARAAGSGGNPFAALIALRRPELELVEVLCAQERAGEPAPSFVRVRGNAAVKGEPVQPAIPSVFGAAAPAIEPRGNSSGRRTALAAWITAPDNPASWRAIANRLWQYHFGRGLCRSPNDFGNLGDLPTHPELLDWLACELVARGESLKAMHRLLVTSAAFRMGSLPDDAMATADPQNDLFWRFDVRRLAAEEIRDSILAVNGTLNLQLGGESVYPPMPAMVLATSSRPDEAWGRSTPEQAARRSAYIHVKRSLLDPLLVSFDLADTDTSCPVRFATVQPTQALTMINGEFINAQAAQFAARLLQVPDARQRVALGLRLVTGREPAAARVDALLALHGELMREHGRTDEQAWQRLCLVLLNLNEFLYLD